MELPKRKLTRLKGYDYSTPGAYFITICVKDRKQLLSKIVGDDAYIVPQNNLSEIGLICDKYINNINIKYENVTIDKYVIMPNHIHLIVEINYDDKKRAIRESPLQYHRSVIDKMVGFLKMNVSKKIHDTDNKKIWQRSYHDHIIRGEKDYQKIWEYIDTNHLKWELDCFYNSETEQ